ncbi:MAG: hypothetical protein ACLUP5_08215 [Streptococcus sp.]
MKTLKMERAMMMPLKHLVHQMFILLQYSSDATMTQALWSSNLVAKKGETGSLTLNFKNGALENKSQANLINK